MKFIIQVYKAAALTDNLERRSPKLGNIILPNQCSSTNSMIIKIETIHVDTYTFGLCSPLTWTKKTYIQYKY